MKTIEAELKFIEDNLGRYSLGVIAQKLERNPSSLETILIRKKGSSNTKESTGMLTAGELAKLIGVDRNTVVGWLQRHGLPYIHKITRFKKRFTFIDTESFWDWAERNREKIDFSKIEKNVLVPEPKWLETERLKKKKLRSYKGWTTEQEKLLIDLIHSGKTIKEIAKIMGRTPYGVEKKYNRLMSNRKED